MVDGTTGQALPDTWVFAIGPTGIAGGAVVRANGTYSVTGLAPGTYRVTFVDPTGVRAQEYWNNAPDFGSATTVNVNAGSDTGTINGSPG